MALIGGTSGGTSGGTHGGTHALSGPVPDGAGNLGGRGTALTATALAFQQDALSGSWPQDGTTFASPRPPRNLDNLEYLGDLRRHQVLLGELSGIFKVSKHPNVETASVSMHGTIVATLTSPGFPMDDQVKLVRGYSDLRIDRIPEIYSQLDDILTFLGAVVPMNLTRKPNTLHVLSAVHSLSILLHMQIKHYLWLPRPGEYAPEIQPLIQTPDHSSYPSGHAVEAFALATVLTRLMTGTNLAASMTEPSLPMLFRVAHRIAVNRTVAGVHFPVDSAAGATLGGAIGEAIGDLGSTAGQAGLGPLNFDPNSPDFAAAGDFTLAWLKAHLRPDDRLPVDSSDVPLFRTQWNAAVAEWR